MRCKLAHRGPDLLGKFLSLPDDIEVEFEVLALEVVDKGSTDKDASPVQKRVLLARKAGLLYLLGKKEEATKLFTQLGDSIKEPDKKQEEKKTEPVISKIDVKPTLTEFGYFKPQFEQQSKTTPAAKNETVTAGIFKTTTGWQDTKYYLLMDQLQPGTIVKIINPGNNKAIYAKVLGKMSGIRQNEGLDIRISNAAASMLEITEQDKFIVNVNY